MPVGARLWFGANWREALVGCQLARGSGLVPADAPRWALRGSPCTCAAVGTPLCQKMAILTQLRRTSVGIDCMRRLCGRAGMGRQACWREAVHHRSASKSVRTAKVPPRSGPGIGGEAGRAGAALVWSGSSGLSQSESSACGMACGRGGAGIWQKTGDRKRVAGGEAGGRRVTGGRAVENTSLQKTQAAPESDEVGWKLERASARQKPRSKGAWNGLDGRR